MAPKKSTTKKPTTKKPTTKKPTTKKPTSKKSSSSSSSSSSAASDASSASSEKHVKKQGGRAKRDILEFAIDKPDKMESFHLNYVNIGKMFKNRGIEDKVIEDMINMDYATFRKMVEDNNMSIPQINVVNEHRKYLTHIIIYPMDQVQKNKIMTAIKKIVSAKLPGPEYSHNVVFIGTEKSETKIKKHTIGNPFSRSDNKVVYQTFGLDFFDENIVDNELCDPMFEVSQEEYDEYVLKNPGFIKDDLPVILMNDPIVIYYGWPKNTLIKIKRKDEVDVVGCDAYRVTRTLKSQISKNG